MRETIRRILDDIYNDSFTLPENFGDAILDEVCQVFQENNYLITRQTVTEQLMWCYMCRMQ